jgi:hypothetical protein
VLALSVLQQLDRCDRSRRHAGFRLRDVGTQAGEPGLRTGASVGESFGTCGIEWIQGTGEILYCEEIDRAEVVGEIQGGEEIEWIERIDNIDNIEQVEEVDGDEGLQETERGERLQEIETTDGEGFPRTASRINSGDQLSGGARPLGNSFRLGATFSSPEYSAYV